MQSDLFSCMEIYKSKTTSPNTWELFSLELNISSKILRQFQNFGLGYYANEKIQILGGIEHNVLSLIDPPVLSKIDIVLSKNLNQSKLGLTKEIPQTSSTSIKEVITTLNENEEIPYFQHNSNFNIVKSNQDILFLQEINSTSLIQYTYNL